MIMKKRKKMAKLNRRQSIIVSITGIFIVSLALIGLTYAYFLTKITPNSNPTSVSVTTANLELVYGDGSGIVAMNNVMPGDPIPVKTFTVTNTGNAIVDNYKVVLENVHNQLELKDDLKYTLVCKQFNRDDYEEWNESENTDKNTPPSPKAKANGGTEGLLYWTAEADGNPPQVFSLSVLLTGFIERIVLFRQIGIRHDSVPGQFYGNIRDLVH